MHYLFRNTLISFLILSPAFVSAQSQKTEEVKDKAVDKAENRLDTRIDQGLDKGLNAVEGLFSKKKKKKATPPTESKSASTSDPTVETNKSSTAVPTSNTSAVEEVSTVDVVFDMDFVGSYSMSINSSKNGKDQGTQNMHYHFNKNLWVMETDTKGDQMRIIMDYDAFTMTTLTENKKGDKSGVKMKMPKWNRNMFETEEVIANTGVDFKKTGRTKTIDGKLCHEYTGTSKDGNFEAWIDESSQVNMAKQFSGFARNGKKQDWQNTPMQGLMMESTWHSADGKETVNMKTLDVKVGSVDRNKFSSDGYEVVDMSSMPGFGG